MLQSGVGHDALLYGDAWEEYGERVDVTLLEAVCRAVADADVDIGVDADMVEAVCRVVSGMITLDIGGQIQRPIGRTSVLVRAVRGVLKLRADKGKAEVRI